MVARERRQFAAICFVSGRRTLFDTSRAACGMCHTHDVCVLLLRTYHAPLLYTRRPRWITVLRVLNCDAIAHAIACRAFSSRPSRIVLIKTLHTSRADDQSSYLRACVCFVAALIQILHNRASPPSAIYRTCSVSENQRSTCLLLLSRAL